MSDWRGIKSKNLLRETDQQRLMKRVAISRAIDMPCILAIGRAFAVFVGLDIVFFAAPKFWPDGAIYFFALRLGVSAWFWLRFILPVGISLFCLRDRIVSNFEAGTPGEGKAIVDFYWSQLGRDLTLPWRFWRA